MERKTVSLISQQGQIFMESLFFICCLLGFLLTVNLFQEYANKEINKHRFKKNYKSRSYKKTNWHSKKNHSYKKTNWPFSQKKLRPNL